VHIQADDWCITLHPVPLQAAPCGPAVYLDPNCTHVTVLAAFLLCS
jgi:hypothetical protein